MNVLLISADNEENENISEIVKTNFPDLRLTTIPGWENIVEYFQYKGPYGVVIIDFDAYNNLNLKIRELVNFVGPRPLILMGNVDDYKPSELSTCGIESDLIRFIGKPLWPEDFVRILETSLDWLQEEHFEEELITASESDFLAVKLKNFFYFNQFSHDVYVKITEKKFGIVIPSNKPFPESEVIKLIRRHIKFLYVYKEDHLKFLEEEMEKLTTDLSKPLGKFEDTVSAQIKSITIIIEYIQNVGVTDTVSQFIESVIHSIHRSYAAIKKVLPILKYFKRKPTTKAEQAFLCMYIGEAALFEMGWQSDTTRNKIGLASILHDISLQDENQIPINSKLDTKYQEMTEKEQQEYGEHPKSSAKYALFFSNIPDTQFIIEQHHQWPRNQGIPGNIHSNKLTGLSTLFIVITNLVGTMAKDGTSNEAIRIFLNVYCHDFNIGNFKKPIDALKTVLDARPS